MLIVVNGMIDFWKVDLCYVIIRIWVEVVEKKKKIILEIELFYLFIWFFLFFILDS